MPDGHAPFALWNRTGNHAVSLLLRSPAHAVVSGRIALITVTGRRTGRSYTFPVDYSRDGELVRIRVGWPGRKVWWRNLREPAAVRMRLRGRECTGIGHAVGDERAGVVVEVRLDD